MLSPKQAAERLGISADRVRKLIASKALHATNIGIDRPVWAIEESELARFAALTRPAHRPRSITMDRETLLNQAIALTERWSNVSLSEAIMHTVQDYLRDVAGTWTNAAERNHIADVTRLARARGLID